MANNNRTKLENFYDSIMGQKSTKFVAQLGEGALIITDNDFMYESLKEYVNNKRYEEFHSTGKITKMNFDAISYYDCGVKKLKYYPGCVMKNGLIRLDERYTSGAKFVFDLPDRHRTNRDTSACSVMMFTTDSDRSVMGEYLRYAVEYCFDMSGSICGVELSKKGLDIEVPKLNCDFVLNNRFEGSYNNDKCQKAFGEVDKEKMVQGLYYEIRAIELENELNGQDFEM